MRKTRIAATATTIPAPVATAPSPQAIQFATTKITAMINAKRSLHGVAPLKADEGLRDIAQKWAENGVFEHSPGTKQGKYGENLTVIGAPATEATGSDDPKNSLRIAADGWYEEIKDYRFDHPDTVQGDKDEFDRAMIGHFTQLVWKASKLIGVGIANIPDDGREWGGGCLIVANFSPTGNVLGSFHENVPPLLKR